MRIALCLGLFLVVALFFSVSWDAFSHAPGEDDCSFVRSELGKCESGVERMKKRIKSLKRELALAKKLARCLRDVAWMKDRVQKRVQGCYKDASQKTKRNKMCSIRVQQKALTSKHAAIMKRIRMCEPLLKSNGLHYATRTL